VDLTGAVTHHQVMRRRIGDLRYLGYVSTQLCGILVPILIFQLTQNAALAGVAMMIEWAPKLFFYLAGGSCIAHYGQRRMHLLLDAVRLLSLSLLLLGTLNLANVWLLAVAAALFQCANAVSNILFELSVTQWWDKEQRALGHSSMIKRDQYGCLTGLLLAAVLADPFILCLIALASQLATIILVHRYAPSIYQAGEKVSAAGRSILRQMRHDMAAFKRPALMRLTFFCMLTRLPIAIVFSMAVFYLHRAQPDLANPIQLFSALMLVRGVGSVLLIEMMQRWMKRGVSEVSLARWGYILMLLSGLAAVLPLPLLPSIVVLLSIILASILASPWQRSNRQQMLRLHTVPEAQAGVTGLMISIEASSYIAGAGLVALFGSDMTMALAVAAVAAAFGTAALFTEAGMWPVRRVKAAVAVTIDR